MKYYKLLTDNEFIGIIDSSNFVRENPSNGWLLTSNENLGQFISLNNKLYRDYWMQPIANNHRSFENVIVTEITQEEYNTLKAAITNNETIIIEDDDEIEDELIVIPDEDPDITLEFIRESKIKEMSAICKHTIESGIDISLRGETHHFSFTIQDQINLMNLSVMAQTQNLLPYHADGEESTFYTAEEINEIISETTQFKTYHLSYFNALKAYINSLDTIEDIAAITYGTPIPDEYKSDVLMVLE